MRERRDKKRKEREREREGERQGLRVLPLLPPLWLGLLGCAVGLAHPQW
jgi:hypothetical protein